MFFFYFHFDEPASELMAGNKGEWSEIYIFLKILVDGKVYAADKNMQKIAERYLKVLKLFREEIKGKTLEYIPGEAIDVFCEGEHACESLKLVDVIAARDRVWNLIKTNKTGTISDEEVQNFLRKMCIAKLKSPAEDKGYFGGTKDIVMEVEDYKTGMASVVGFSCKSEFSAQATLFNASKDNTNFLFRIEGPMNDALAAEFNSMFDARGAKQVVATARRMRLLKDRGCSIVFERAVEATARRNLAMVGGRETAAMVAEMLRRYYYDGEGASSFSSMSDLVHWLAVNNTCNVEDIGGVEAVYWYQISHLLYAMFTGMRLGSVWSGRSSVNGGYIIARNDGEVLAYHTCIADEFMDFLVQRLALEQPSHGRHLSMCIEKGDDGKYYIKLPLQVRFKAMKQSQEPTA